MSVETLFAPRVMGPVVENFAEREPGFFASLFAEGGVSRQMGPLCEWLSITHGRTPAPMGSVSAPSVNRNPIDQAIKKERWLEVSVNKTFQMQELTVDRTWAGSLMPDAPTRLAAELSDLTNQVLRTINLSCAHVAMEKTGFTANGTTVPGSPAGYSRNVDYDTQDLNAGASWALPSTEILSVEMKALHRKARTVGAFIPGRAIANMDVNSYLLDNDKLADYYSGLIGGQMVMTSGDFSMLGGLGGVPRWDFVEDTYDLSGVQTKYVANDYILFLPRSLVGVTMLCWGYVAVAPEGGDVIGSSQAPGDPRPGIVAYAVRLSDPYSVKLVVSARWLPVFVNPLRTVLLDTTP